MAMLDLLKLLQLPDMPSVTGSKATEIVLLALSLLLIAYSGFRLSGGRLRRRRK